MTDDRSVAAPGFSGVSLQPNQFVYYTKKVWNGSHVIAYMTSGAHLQ